LYYASITLTSAQTYSHCDHYTPSSTGGGRLQTPRFPKPREVGWWLVLTAAGEVLATKRVGRLSTRSNNNNSSSISAEVTLLFQPPEALGDAEMTLYAVADSAMGLDAELVLPVQVVKA
jgi:hypothetical protein